MASIPQHSDRTSISDALHNLRRLVERYVVTQTLIWMAILFLTAFWLAGFIDYFPVMMGASESPRWARALMLLGLLIGLTMIFYRMGFRRWWVRWTDSSLAQLIERRFPHFNSSLITTIQAEPTKQLRTKQSTESPSSTIAHDEKLLSISRIDAVTKINSIDVGQVVQWHPLQIQSATLGGILAVSLLLTFWQPLWTLHWSKRLFVLSNEAWPRMARLSIEGLQIDVPRFQGEVDQRRYMRSFDEGVASVPRGQSARLLAYVDPKAQLVPQSCTLTYRDSEQRSGRAGLRRMIDDNKQKLPFILEGPPLDSINDNLSLTLQAGDARLAGLRLKTIEAPQILKLFLVAQYPEYLRQRRTSVWLDETIEYRNGMRLPQGTIVKLVGEANIALDHCDCRITASTDQGIQGVREIATIAATAIENRFELPLGPLNEGALVELLPWESSGHSATKVQQFVLNIIEDQEPKIDMVLNGIGSVITDQAILPVAAKIEDDYDVSKAWFELYLNEDKPKVIDTSANREGNVNQSIDLRELKANGALKVAPGQTLALTLVASDYYNLTPEPRYGRSPPIQLGIVTADQLLVMLERRELAMRSRMELVISELSQLRELLARIVADRSEKPVTAEADQQVSAKDESGMSPNKQAILRLQQCISQSDKSTGELKGILQEISQITQELVNNRVDSRDRQERLSTKVARPLQKVLDTSMKSFSIKLNEAEKSYDTPSPDEAIVPTSIDLVNKVIIDLETILADMADLQDFNELVDMVRSMIDDQQRIIDETKTQQKKKVIDLFK